MRKEKHFGSFLLKHNNLKNWTHLFESREQRVSTHCLICFSIYITFISLLYWFIYFSYFINF